MAIRNTCTQLTYSTNTLQPRRQRQQTERCHQLSDLLKAKSRLLFSQLRTRMESSTSAQTRHLVSELRQELERVLPRAECRVSTDKSTQRLFECSCCEGFMSQPVCLPCGHTACRSCLDRPSEQAGSIVTCPRCKEKHPKIPLGGSSPRKTTLLLQNIQQKWFPDVLECCRHREDGNRFALEGNFPQAIDAYEKAARKGTHQCSPLIMRNCKQCNRVL